MSNISDLLNEISAEALKLGIDPSANMYPGASIDQITSALRGLPIVLPVDVTELYLWRNGVRLEGQEFEIRMFPAFYFRSIEISADTTRELLSLAHDPEMQWQRSWFSLCADLAGDYYVLDARSSGEEAGKIIALKEGLDPFPAFWSFETMLTSVLECYRAGAYALDEDGNLIEDDATSDSIYRDLNRGLSPHHTLF